MSQYVHGSGWTWNQYLQMKSFEDGIRWDIRDSALKIGGSLDALKESGVRVEKAIGTASTAIQGAVRSEGAATRQALDSGFSRVEAGLDSGFRQVGEGLERIDASLDRVDDTLQAGFVRLHFDLEDVQASLTDMSAKFDYGFAQLSTQLGSIGDTLQELKQIAKTPEQTWAFEQFAIAREAHERGLYEEALTYVTRAIDGHQSHTGFMLEHRFHYFQGVLRRGDHREDAREIVDLALAEKAFINAARYARATHKLDAARSLCCAGHAAIWQGNVPTAMQHTEAALVLHPNLPHAHYQMARLKFHVDDINGALPSLQRAIELDPLFSVKCLRNDAEELDFVRHEPQVVKLITAMRDERLKLTAEKCARARQVATQMKTETSTRLAQLAEQVRSFVAATPGSTYELKLPDLGSRFKYQEEALAVSIAACGNSVPYIDAIKTSDRGNYCVRDLISEAEVGQAEIESEIRRDRTRQPAPALALVKMPTALDESSAGYVDSSERHMWGIGLVLVGFLAMMSVVLATYDPRGKQPPSMFGVLVFLLFAWAAWSSFQGGVVAETIQKWVSNSKVRKLREAATMQADKAKRDNERQMARHDAVLTANVSFDEKVRVELSRLSAILRGVKAVDYA